MDERVLLDTDGVYCWRGRRMGATLFTARLGRLVLTDHRLLFLTAGGTDAVPRFGNSVGRFTLAADSGVDVEALEHPDSREFLLVNLATYDVVSKTFKSWLHVAGPDTDGTKREHSFSTRTHLPGGATWQVHMDAARRALGVAQRPASRSSA